MSGSDSPRGAERAGPSQHDEQTVSDAIPAIARVAAIFWIRGATWGVQRTLHASARVARATTDPEQAAELIAEVSTGLRTYAREFLGVEDLDERVKQLAPGTALQRRDGVGSELALREKGAELLALAADVDYEDGAHPAYARILTELAPDEARILRLLAVEGPQPAVDVRAANLIGVGSQLVAPGLNMIGPQAGVRYHDKVPAYLNNLYRLGLIWFSQEPLGDALVYQVLEAQPDVLQAIKETTRAKTVQRSIHLTPFGHDFCMTCLPLDISEVQATNKARLDAPASARPGEAPVVGR